MNVYDYRPNDEKVAIMLLVAVVCMLVTFSIGYLLAFRNTGTNVSDNGDGINHIGEQLGTAVGNQQQITDGIKDAEHTSNAAAGTAQTIAESAHSIEAGVGEAAGLIDSSQQILGRVRTRGKK